MTHAQMFEWFQQTAVLAATCLGVQPFGGWIRDDGMVVLVVRTPKTPRAEPYPSEIRGRPVLIVECSSDTAGVVLRTTIPQPPAPETPEQPTPIDVAWTDWTRSETNVDQWSRRRGPLSLTATLPPNRKYYGTWEIRFGTQLIASSSGGTTTLSVLESADAEADRILAKWARTVLKLIGEQLDVRRQEHTLGFEDQDESDLFRMEHRGAADALENVSRFLHGLSAPDAP